MNSFVKRLTACSHAGSLSTSDLACWFDIPYPTMWSWLHGTRANTSRPVYQQRFERLEAPLAKLESYIKKHAGFPIPFEIGLHIGRKAYIKQVRDGYRTRLPSSDPASGRVQVRSGDRRRKTLAEIL